MHYFFGHPFLACSALHHTPTAHNHHTHRGNTACPCHTSPWCTHNNIQTITATTIAIGCYDTVLSRRRIEIFIVVVDAAPCLHRGPSSVEKNTSLLIARIHRQLQQHAIIATTVHLPHPSTLSHHHTHTPSSLSPSRQQQSSAGSLPYHHHQLFHHHSQRDESFRASSTSASTCSIPLANISFPTHVPCFI